jgi:hypothetical protein
MAREVRLRLTGKAEEAVEKLKQHGLAEHDIFARALWIFEQAVSTGRVALLNKSGSIEYRLGLETSTEPQAALADPAPAPKSYQAQEPPPTSGSI